ncbi:hypothetical protein AB0D86_43835 [Streptomyces sp. NPDC048324]|uniref:hypothetical protein n=1 Tax=Streptomyces sp. NPDC048324 TaxID=3157205 RepID=UPI00343FA353
MYSLTPGFRFPVQRGLSPTELVLTKTNAGAGAALMASALLQTPPIWTFGAVAGIAGIINLAPGRRSIARWAAIGVRHWRERHATPDLAKSAGTTRTWTLYPYHGTMQDPYQRVSFHESFGRALTYVAGQSRNAGIQVHVTHHAEVGDATAHTQTISAHIPKNLVAHPERVFATIEREFTSLGALAEVTPDPAAALSECTPGWVALEDGRYAATARITAWPAETGGDLMANILLGQHRPLRDRRQKNRSISVLYRPIPIAQARLSAKLGTAAAEAFTVDQVKQDGHAKTSGTVHQALVQGGTLVDVDAYLTVWGDSPETVDQARLDAQLDADEHRLRLDWLTGQQHRAHVMTTPHGASTRKGAIL